MKKSFFLTAAAIAMTSTLAFAAQYKVTAPLGAELNGHTAYLSSYDTGAAVDSAIVADGKAVFRGDIDEPMAVRLSIDGKRLATFILEDGSIAYNGERREAFGSPLNDASNEFDRQMAEIYAPLENATTDEEKQKIYASVNELVEKTMAENNDNPLGYLLFLQMAYDMTSAELNEYLAKYPSFSDYKRIQNLIEANKRKDATSEGMPFVDFEVSHDGKTWHLSDYVGKGKYVLVDFWASWCGPCIRETKTLKEIYNKYKDTDKLTVLGVAVWDEPQNTLQAINMHKLPWESMINAQTGPTDLYGISGIPCIILFGPDGTIISRGLQGADLKAKIDEVVK